MERKGPSIDETSHADFAGLISVWKTLIDCYMKYVTLWFSAAGLGFLVLSFGVKAVVVDETRFATKVGVTVFLNLLVSFALLGFLIIKPRADAFAKGVSELGTILANRLSEFGHFVLPGNDAMRLLIRFALLGIGAAQAFLIALLLILCLRSASFPGM